MTDYQEAEPLLTDTEGDFELQIEELEDRAQPMPHHGGCACTSSCDCTSCSCVGYAA